MKLKVLLALSFATTGMIICSCSKSSDDYNKDFDNFGDLAADITKEFNGGRAYSNYYDDYDDDDPVFYDYDVATEAVAPEAPAVDFYDYDVAAEEALVPEQVPAEAVAVDDYYYEEVYP